ncbi:BTAD domain-containing putative transcriptional regulator [Terrabacter sp. BE26]|uniref:AfsR/SARP family transcriptional regulator n=1 Tax=Terrabacter sp. BE26 TaxID=2898152 RepID=UPI0035BE3D8E
MDTTTGLRVRLCGGLVVGDGDLTLGPRGVGGTKSRQVLLALLFEAGGSVSKGRLIEFLWGGAPPAGALGTLEAYVSVLRKRLGTVFHGASPVVTVPGGYRWDVDRAPVDVVEFARLAAAARAAGSSGAAALDSYAAALALVERPLAPVDGDLPWLEEHVSGHHARVLRVLTDAARLALDHDEPARAETWARAAIERDVLVEAAWQVLLESLERQGRQAEAMREYETCRSIFADELGCDPGPGLRVVFTRLLAATSSDDDGLRDLVDAVVRLHVGLLAHGAPARGAGRLPVTPTAGGRGTGAAAQPQALASLEEDCRRLRSLLRAASASVPVSAALSVGRPAERVRTAATA